MPLNEFDIIQHYFTRQPKQPSVAASVGDDCAIVTVPANKQLVMSMDTVVEGRHFPEGAPAYDIATRALCTSLSDLAAMGAKPLWFTLGLTLPSVSQSWLEQFSQGLFDIASRFECDLIGGDTTQGPLTITVQVHGEVSPDHVLTRKQAQVGDYLLLSGSVGDGAAALAAIQQTATFSDNDYAYLYQRFYQPLPHIDTGQALASLGNAAIDISDGLLADASHIAQASQVSLHIDVENLPLSPALQALDKQQAYQWALTGGDDYRLLVSVPPHNLEQALAIESDGQTLSVIGRVIESDLQGQVKSFYHGQPYSLSQHSSMKGYQHFAS